MKKKIINDIKTGAIVIPIILLARISIGEPWWLFVIPVLLIGVFITYRKWQIDSFIVGFLSGFIVWLGANIYFHLTFHDLVLAKVGSLLSVPEAAIIFFSGLIGGLLTGLALYTGKIMVYKRDLKPMF
jgi:hypothetical protein